MPENFDIDYSNGYLPVPQYYSDLCHASHFIYMALENMSVNPVCQKDEYKELIDIHEKLGDLTSKILVRAEKRNPPSILGKAEETKNE